MLEYLHDVFFWVGVETVAAVSTLWFLWKVAKVVARAQIRRKAREG